MPSATEPAKRPAKKRAPVRQTSAKSTKRKSVVRGTFDPVTMAEKMAQEIIVIADDMAGDYVQKESAKGQVSVVLDRGNIARAKLRIDARMWLMARLAPHIYGSAGPKSNTSASEPFGLEVDLRDDGSDTPKP